MDMDALIDEICRRVQQKIQALENRTEDTKPAILILTPDHGTVCHEMLEDEKLAECYRTECALLKEYQCSPADYEAVVAYGMSNESLGKIAYGIFDSGYTRLFGQSILAGKKAPKAYYGCLEASLEMLKNSGVTIASQSQIPDLILHGEPEEGVEPEGPSKDCEVPKKDESCVKEAVLDKRVITEKDMIDLGNNRVRKVTVGEKAILTDLAREYASKHRITVLRRGTSSGKGHSL